MKKQMDDLKKIRDQFGRMTEHLSDEELKDSIKSAKTMGMTLPEYIVWELRYHLNQTDLYRLVWKLRYSVNELAITCPNPINNGIKKSFNDFMDSLIKFMNSHEEMKVKLFP